MKIQEVEHFLSLSVPELCSIQKTPEGERYTLTVIGWPGCSASGATRDEAGKALQVAKRNWLVSRGKQGLDVPMPNRDVQAHADALANSIHISKQIVATVARDAKLAIEITEQWLTEHTLYDLVAAVVVCAAQQSRSKKKVRQARGKDRTAVQV